MDYLKELENESIHIIRETISNFYNPVFLYSIGKDSCVLYHLIKKAIYPNPIPFKIAHIDTHWKFKEMIKFRRQLELRHDFIVWDNKDGLKDNINPIDYPSDIYTSIMKTDALKQLLDHYKFDGIICGARRSEELSRSKERIFSHRTKHHKWDPRSQQPELWSQYNSLINDGESVRIFPLSNWTELDIWKYIKQESIPIVSLYFAKMRPTVEINNNLIMVDDERILRNTGEPQQEMIRFRTLGCYPLTGAIKSTANTLDLIIKELEEGNHSERSNRLIDYDKSSMEDKKQKGYF